MIVRQPQCVAALGGVGGLGAVKSPLTNEGEWCFVDPPALSDDHGFQGAAEKHVLQPSSTHAPNRAPDLEDSPPAVRKMGDWKRFQPSQPDADSPCPPESKEGTSAVSLLQEFVQARCDFCAHQKILSWTFEQHVGVLCDKALGFRSTVQLNGLSADLPQKFCGGWQTSKKKAQRDTAERVLWYFKNAGEDVALPPVSDRSPAVHQDIVKLQNWVGKQTGKPSSSGLLVWNFEEEVTSVTCMTRFRATVSFLCGSGAPQHFCAGFLPTKEAAMLETAQRVLWFAGVVSVEQ
jgi:hypothetical protein